MLLCSAYLSNTSSLNITNATHGEDKDAIVVICEELADLKKALLCMHEQDSSGIRKAKGQ